MSEDREFELLYARARELTERNGVTTGEFYNPREQFFLSKYLERSGASDRILFYGGYGDSERKMLFLIPDYFEAILVDSSPEERCAAAAMLMAAEISENIIPVVIRGSGYRKISHRDVMGAVLALGIERSVVGDIVMNSDSEAVVFVESRISRFILDSLESVGSDRVKTEIYTLPDGFGSGRTYKRIDDTVASERFDCVAAALVSISRDDAKSLILSGAAEVNYSVCKKPDSLLSEGDVVTLHGYGKFILDSISDKTKKGRLRLVARKFV